MQTFYRLYFCLFVLLVGASDGFANPLGDLEPRQAIVCPANPSDSAPPDFTDSSCERVAVNQIDAQGRLIWAATNVETSPEFLASGAPAGVFISTKASSEVYLNGTLIGANGVPAATKRGENPGRMDAVIFAPRDLLRVGRNDVVLKMSAHHGYLRLEYPTHYISLGAYGEPSREILRYYWPSLIPFGALILGVVYFGVCAMRGEAVKRSLILCAISISAAGQLLSEISRGLFSYAYPVQDIRLLLITAFSAGFGLCLAAHIFGKFAPNRRLPALGLSLALIAITIPFVPGFDAKAVTALLIPTIASALAVALWTFQKKPQAAWYLLALAAFIMIILSLPGQFLDTIFFYTVAALILFLLVEQAVSLAREKTLRRLEESRTERLELALEQAKQKSTAQKLKLTNGKKTDYIEISQIVHCKGAGDYAEIILGDGSQLLHSASLGDLEASLPSSFLRVHRSYIVNTNFVQSLTRESSGVGVLLLTTGDQVPVSRRILPKVRNALA